MIKLHYLHKRSTLLLVSLIVTLLFTLSSCGGGAAASLAGVGSGGTGVVVQGLVTGFGSVFIDGTEYFLGSNTQVKEQFDGSSQTGLFSLGQIVTATVDSSNNVVSAEISPDLQGVITFKPTAFNTTAVGTCSSTTDYYVYVLNQKVRIVTQSCNTPLGVTTVFNEPYTLCSVNNSCSNTSTNGLPAFVGNLTSGSEVKVHGFWTINHNLPELVATRIDQYYLPNTSNVYNSSAPGLTQNLPASVYELSGIVTPPSPTSSVVSINGGNGASGVAGGSTVTATSLPSTIAVNEIVSMSVQQSVWSSYFGSVYDQNSVVPTTSLPVSNLVINTATNFISSTSPSLQVSGIISYVNGSTAIVNGTQVILPAGCTNCNVGDYVRVKGSTTNSQGELEGSNVEYSATNQITLKGILVFPVITANAATVVFQGTSVYVPNTAQSGCVTGSSQYVVVNASYSGNTLIANSITCTNISSTNLQNTAVDYVGTTNNYSPNSSTFTLTVNSVVYTVNYNSNTYVEHDLLSTAPNNQFIEVIGQITGTNTITASALKVAESNNLKSNSD
ncbi:MAG: hypothetical protein KGQ44_06150 [Betaproteobacteria bacterium]|nr:hypothetical protein [Betaproteobacteria bacterium]